MKITITILSILLSIVISAQTKSDEEFQKNEHGSFDIFALPVKPDNFILEEKIDPKTYILGPGDQLNIFLGGLYQQSLQVLILPEGNIIIDQVGSIYIADLPLEIAKKKIAEFVQTSLKIDAIDISLLRIRKFKVAITGQVKNPSIYSVSGIDRLHSVINQAGGVASWGDIGRIQLERNENSQMINLWNFLYKGDKESNPTLRMGDKINIPMVDLSKPYVKVTSIRGAEAYRPLMGYEEIAQFLDRNKILGGRSNINSIKVIRQNKEFLVQLENTDRDAFILQSGDEIAIPVLRNEVYVTGEILNPGAYPFIANYKAWDYIAKAGILETSDELSTISVYRFDNNDIEYGPDVIVSNGDIVYIPRKSRETVKDWAEVLTPVISILLTVYIAFGK
jgi:polysaccharide export outer membrane protein